MFLQKVDVESLQLPEEIYYILPLSLLHCLSTPGQNLLDANQLEHEKAVSEIARQLDCIGFRASVPINHPLLNETAARIDQSLVAPFDSENAVEIAEHFNETVEQAHRFMQAYCGWLVQNRDFKSDLDQQRDQSLWNRTGLPRQAFAIPEEAEAAQGEELRCVQNWSSFLEKWRLQGMDTLDLPRPLAPQFTPDSIYASGQPEGLHLPAIPDIYRIEAKGLFASQIEYMRTNESEHLDEWKQLIKTTSRRIKRVDSLGRQYQLQHYWRVLTQRYPEQFARKNMKLQQLFADYFGVQFDSIKRDLKKVQAVVVRPLSTQI